MIIQGHPGDLRLVCHKIIALQGIAVKVRADIEIVLQQDDPVVGLGQAPAFQDMGFQSQIFLLINDLFFPKGPGKGPCIVQYVCIIAPVNADDELCPLSRVFCLQQRPQDPL